MKIYTTKDVNLNMSEELKAKAKWLSENFWYKKRAEKAANVNDFAQVLQRELGFERGVSFTAVTRGEEESFAGNLSTMNANLQAPFTIPVYRDSKFSYVTSIYLATHYLFMANLDVQYVGEEDNEVAVVVSRLTGDVVLEDAKVMGYIGMTASAYAVQLFALSCPEKYATAIREDTLDIR